MKPLAALLLVSALALVAYTQGWIDGTEEPRTASWDVDPETGHSELRCE